MPDWYNYQEVSTLVSQLLGPDEQVLDAVDAVSFLREARNKSFLYRLYSCLRPPL